MPTIKKPGKLERISAGADDAYSEYRASVKLEAEHVRPLPSRLGRLSIERGASHLRGAPSAEIAAAAAEHYDAHKDDYHDLALMLAQMADKEIDVAEPLVIGRKVDAAAGQVQESVPAEL